jgi:NADH/F420H2 dehydrogenase subunit C
MGLNPENFLALVQERISPEITDGSSYLRSADGTASLDCPKEHIIALLRYLRDDCEPRFRLLTSLTATDESIPETSSPESLSLREGAKERFRVVYHMQRVGEGNEPFHVRLVVWTHPKTAMPSCVSLFPGADWFEREVFDMFGIVFEGHPDLKRILMPDGYNGFPLRKDFPLRGKDPSRIYREWNLLRLPD